MTGILVKIRATITDLLNKKLYKSALFWADKAASLSQYQACDVYWLAQCMYYTGQFDRAAHIIVRRNLHLQLHAFRYLAAKCYASSKDWQLALNLLDMASPESDKKQLPDSEQLDGIPKDKDMISAMHVLKGDIYEAMDIREVAADCYKDALRADILCYEAFDCLVSHHMLRAEEEQDLLESMLSYKQCQSPEEEQIIRFLYGMKLKKYNKPGKFEIPPDMDSFHENLDVATSLAERHYYNCEFQSSYRISQGVLKTDPFHESCLPLHVALLVELKETNKLFFLAHQLVDKYPQLPISWYAVGCYYLVQKKQDLARRYLLKTTLLDKNYGASWLAYGHSFAAENEHDQAMAAYFTASQLMRGCHLPFLYIGLEYSVTNNTKLAEKFFSTALNVCPDDPHVLHEMGVAAYTNNNLAAALKYFNDALQRVELLEEEITVVEWEPLLNNLGHVHRKLKNYEKSLQYHHQALSLCPHSSSTYTAIAYVYSFLGNYDEAIKYLHKSLSLRRDDAFTSTLLDVVIEQFALEDVPVCDVNSLPLDEGLSATQSKIPALKKHPTPCMTSPTKMDDDAGDAFGNLGTLRTPGSGLTLRTGRRVPGSGQVSWDGSNNGETVSRKRTCSDIAIDSDDMELDESMNS